MTTMQPMYEHRQFGQAMVFFLLLPTLGLVMAVVMTSRPGELLPLWVIVAFMLFTSLIFSSLTVSVDAEAVRLNFGLNTFRRTFRLDEISTVRPVRNPIWMGLGIHFIRKGMIYNVSGLDGVELTFTNGRVVRIGTDEPVELAQAIEQAMRALPKLVK